jgi:hypothetical protein
MSEAKEGSVEYTLNIIEEIYERVGIVEDYIRHKEELKDSVIFDVTRMAEECGLLLPKMIENFSSEKVQEFMRKVDRFSNMVAEAEREMCARVAEEPWQGHPKEIAAAIRNRVEK